MQKILSKYGLAAHLAVLAVAPLVVSPVAVICLAALSLIWLVMEPPLMKNEGLAAARRRSLGKVLRDPMTWVLLAVSAFTLIRALNDGLTAVYDAERAVWSVGGAATDFPAAVQGRGFPEFASLVALTVILAGCRNVLGKSGRVAFLSIVTVITGLHAVLWGAYVSTVGAEWLELARARLENPAFAGTVFGAYLLVSAAVLPAVMERHWVVMMLLSAFAAGANAAGVFLFAPPAVAALYFAAALVIFIYAVVHTYFVAGSGSALSMLLMTVICLATAAVFAYAVLPAELMAEKLAPFASGEFVPEGFPEARELLSKYALVIWKSSPWVGSGLGAFPLRLSFVVSPEHWSVISPLQIAPFNGYWSVLAERGIVGAFTIGCPFLILVTTWFYRMGKGILAGMPAPMCLAGPIAIGVAITETLYDCAPLEPGTLVVFSALVAVSAAAFPKEKR